jgi:hypothetical protein
MMEAVHVLLVMISFGGMGVCGISSKGMREFLLLTTGYVCGAAAMAGIWIGAR